jgi:tetratricopeptide (TPR) repeat protein
MPIDLSDILVAMVSSALYDGSKEKLREAIKDKLDELGDDFGWNIYKAMEKAPTKEIQMELARHIAKYMIEDVKFAQKIRDEMDSYKSELEMSILKEKDSKEQGYKLMFLSDCYLFSEEESKKAKTKLDSSLDIFKRIDDKIGMGQVLVKIGNYYNILNRDEDAMKCYEEALEILGKMEEGGAYWRAAINNNIGNILAKNEKYDDAENKYKEALKDSKGYLKSEALLNLGNIYRRQRNFIEAKNNYEACITNVEGGIHPLVNLLIEKMASIGLANVSLEMGTSGFTNAIHYYENSLRVMKELGNKRGMCIAEMNIGTVHYMKKDFENAYKIYDESIKIASAIKDKLLECTIQMNMGNAERGMKHHGEAKEIYEAALNNYNNNIKSTGLRFVDEEELTTKMPSMEAQLLGNLGNVCLELNDFNGAIDNYGNALKSATGNDNKYLRIHLLMHLGVAHCNKGDGSHQKEAMDCWGQSIKLMQSMSEGYKETPDYEIVHDWIERLRGRR